nr:hypothetical protein [Tanacetum cinerariifolium]
MDINIDALYNILKQNQGDVNDALGYKKKDVVVTSDPLALVAEKTKVKKRKEKVEVQTESEGSDDDDISDLKKITALLAKAFNQKKYYAKPTNNNLGTSSAFYSANKKPEYVKSVEKKEDKKADEKKRDMSKFRHFAKDCKKAKVKDYNYYKTKMLLAKKDSDKQVLFVEDQAWMESSSDSDQEINANMVFMAQIENVLSDSDESSSSAKEIIADVAYYTYESESESEYESSEYYDNSTNYGLFVNDNDDQEFFHDAIESASENFIENHIDSQKDYDKSEVDHNDSEEKEHLVDKLIQKFNHKIAKYPLALVTEKEKVTKRKEKVEVQSESEGSDDEDISDLKKITALLAKDFKQKEGYAKPTNNNLRTSTASSSANKKPKYLNDSDQEINANMVFMAQMKRFFQIPTKVLHSLKKPLLRLQEKILEKEMKILELEGCVSNIDVEIEKYLERLNECENKLHNIGQTNQTIHMIMPSKDTLYNGRKGIGFENPSYFEKAKDLRPSLYDGKINFSDDYFQEIINPDFEKIDSLFQQTSSLKLYVPTVILEKIIIDLEDEVVSLLEKEKANLETIESLKSKDTFSSVRRPKQSSVIWKKKGSSNTSNVDLSSFDENNLFIFDDESVRISLVSKMPFRKKPRNSMNVHSKRNSNKSLPKTVHMWLPKMQQLAEPVAKWIPKIVQIYLWIIDSGCSKHMTGNHALLTNFVEKFLGTVRFGNNDFAVITDYGDVVIGSMTIKKVYYVEGL